jgi:hypothetical protein
VPGTKLFPYERRCSGHRTGLVTIAVSAFGAPDTTGPPHSVAPARIAATTTAFQGNPAEMERFRLN